MKKALFKRRAPEERRRAILTAARDVLQKKDYHEIRMEDVARRAGVAKGTLYLYFRTKEGLFGALVCDVFERARERWRSISAKSPPGERRVRALIAAQLEFFEENRGLFLQVFQGYLPVRKGTGSRKRCEMIMANIRVLADAVEEAVKLNRLRAADPALAAVALFGMIRGFVFSHILGGLPGRLPDRAEIIWDCFYRGMRVPS